uniref:MLN64 N-terminal domain-like protein n=1 Tax=Philothamnus irregularis TaxID=1899461 RepID=A0A0B8RUB3_9SAUR
MLKLKQSCCNQRQDELDIRRSRKCPRQQSGFSSFFKGCSFHQPSPANAKS